MNAIGMAVTRPINDWCPNGDAPPASTASARAGSSLVPAVAEGWDDWGPFYTPMYSQHIGLNGSTVEMCNSTGRHCLRRRRVDAVRAVASAPGWRSTRSSGRRSSTTSRSRTTSSGTRPRSTGAAGRRASAGVLSGAVRRRQQLDDGVPAAYVIPIGAGQRSDAEANRLVEWLLDNGIEVTQTTADYTWEGRHVQEGVVCRLDEPAAPRPCGHRPRYRRRHLRLDHPAVRATGGLESRLPVGRGHRHDPEGRATSIPSGATSRAREN